jgi:hypothetical protein
VTVGRAIRQQATMDSWRCPQCEHENDDHLEKQFGSVGYKPAVFHCTHKGCDCVIDLSQACDRPSRSHA